MLQVSLREAKQYLSRYIDEVSAGKEIIITRRGTPIARLVPIKQKSKSKSIFCPFDNSGIIKKGPPSFKGINF